MTRRHAAAILLLLAAGLILGKGTIVPGGELRVLIIEEARNRGTLLDTQQEMILGDSLKSHIEAKGGKFRAIDKDAKDVPAEWQPLFVGDPAMIPRIAIARGKKIKVGPLPKTTEAAIAAIQ